MPSPNIADGDLRAAGGGTRSSATATNKVIGVVCSGDIAVHRDKVKIALERGKAQRPDAVWVCFEPRSDRITYDLMLSLGLEPVVLPMTDAWRYPQRTPRGADTFAAVGSRNSTGQSRSGTEALLSGELEVKADPGSNPGETRPSYDLRRTWRDNELLQLCDELVVFHNRTGNSPWREKAKSGLWDGRLFLVELGDEPKKVRKTRKAA